MIGPDVTEEHPVPREIVDIETADPERAMYLDYAFEHLSHAQAIALLHECDDDLTKHLVREGAAPPNILERLERLPSRSMYYEREYYLFNALSGLTLRQMAELLREHDGELWDFICDKGAGPTGC